MNHLHTHYGGHFEDLSEALKDNSSSDAREALSLLHSDGVAQVMSFMCKSFVSDIFLTLSAVSPEMRLDAGVITGDYSPYPDCVQVKAIEQRLLFCISATGPLKTSPALVNSLWWANWRGMAVKLDADNACSDLLAHLSDRLRSRVVALEILVSEATLCRRCSSRKKKHARNLCDGQCGTLLCALSTFSNLTSLSIKMKNGVFRVRSDAAVRRALSVAAEMQISAIELESTCQIRDFSALPPSQHLRCLTARNCGIQSLTGLERYSMLSSLDVTDNGDLRSLRGLADAPRLEKIVASFCNLQDVEGLGECLQLREIDVTNNRPLRSLRGLAAVPQLEKVMALYSGLRDVDDLSQCLVLKEIDVTGNRLLRSLRGLAGAPRLEKVVAWTCGFRDVDGLGQCPHLREVEFTESRGLRSLRGLAGAPRLERIDVAGCNLRDVDGLCQCPHLREIDVSSNRAMLNLYGLVGAPNLRKIKASDCGEVDVQELSNRLPSCEID